ncbi:hypothetical protein PsB1_1730 [Candidatus Phycosocius spiralis]|uniref:Uncharacterized protein n=1 Tax=Candidatus Phycosocius spiralis TaxID=2815099 RepID=A0ABQ4PX98_9PROT|nr:hypothetical protein PsB1_1730 [Candidatus Phycosocius spiralis]
MKLHPAPRMAMDPTIQASIKTKSKLENPMPARPKNCPMKQGSANSQNPIGRSNRDKRKYGRHALGAWSTKPMGSASKGIVTQIL